MLFVLLVQFPDLTGFEGRGQLWSDLSLATPQNGTFHAACRRPWLFAIIGSGLGFLPLWP